MADLNYGMKAKDPTDYVLFYKKEMPDKTFFIPKEKVTASHMLSLVAFT